MKFLLDQDVYAGTIKFLRALGHDVVTAADLGMSRSADDALLLTAHLQGRLFVTRDRDFGSLVFVQGNRPGIIYLRMLPVAMNPVHAELERVLQLYSETELAGSFVVVEPGRHRIRRL
jgi:predicted nuclease of predicted toxin-antitoxin system